MQDLAPDIGLPERVHLSILGNEEVDVVIDVDVAPNPSGLQHLGLVVQLLEKVCLHRLLHLLALQLQSSVLYRRA
jgi:hypothetical protein